MATAFPEPTRPGLTLDLWLNIARYLDADSLFSFQESKLVNIDFLESWVVTEAVVLSPHSNDELLAAFLDCIDENNVKSVCVANCLMASPDHLLDRISSLSNLVKLDCVNCRISPRLDVGSLLAFQDSQVVSVDFLQSRAMTRVVMLSPHSDDEVLAAFLKRICLDSVECLCVANCFMASPNRLLDCISGLGNLVQLDCVGCHIIPRRLFRTISKKLPELRKLSFSLNCESAGYGNFSRERNYF
ncbi:hypothetical protein MTO96_039082 [Rhipicephalus appendiculatus]